MNTLYVIAPNPHLSPMLKKMVEATTAYEATIHIHSLSPIPNLRGKKIIFVLELSHVGVDLPMLHFFEKLYKRQENVFQASYGMILVHSHTEHSTKRASQDLIYLANALGCTFIGHPVVEATASLRNFLTWQKTLSLSLEDICLKMCTRLKNRLLEYSPTTISSPKMLVLYSSPHETSNTLDLWHMVSRHLKDLEIKELQIENGEVLDCKGCSYTLCRHYGKQNKCFYGGVMVKDVLPSIEEADAIVWLCPNYNDAIAANLTAVINRLTVLYRQMQLYCKSIFGVIVSGNSGSDSIAKQLIGALNINKGFYLPPYFCITAIANDPGAIFKIPDIEKRAEKFAYHIQESFHCIEKSVE